MVIGLHFIGADVHLNCDGDDPGDGGPGSVPEPDPGPGQPDHPDLPLGADPPADSLHRDGPCNQEEEVSTPLLLGFLRVLGSPGGALPQPNLDTSELLQQVLCQGS